MENNILSSVEDVLEREPWHAVEAYESLTDYVAYTKVLLSVSRRFSTTGRAAVMSETEASGSTPMEQSISEESAKVSNDQPGMKEVDTSKELGRLAVNIMPHILNLYNCQPTALDFEIYASDATFEDPLMCAKGVKQIKSAFYSMPKIFSEGKMAEYYVQEDETSPGNGEIRIDNVQHYKIMGHSIEMRSLIKLRVTDGKIIRHEDLWDKNAIPVLNTKVGDIHGYLLGTSRIRDCEYIWPRPYEVGTTRCSCGNKLKQDECLCSAHDHKEQQLDRRREQARAFSTDDDEAEGRR
ncbi:hypothetical protein R1flu_009313 [Riccia fluitans]|uniref:Uncharacterized protein n=1 Tax=Riccia fluitans TaxID=41844 RepID=A0ABD1Z1R3_9MARC